MRVYRGADGRFELYEDDGKTFDCERGEYSLIPFVWNEKERTLSIEKRRGTYKGMSKEREFRIVLVSSGKGGGVEKVSPDKVIKYTGKKIDIKL